VDCGDCGELGVWYGLEGRDPNLKFYLRAVIKQTVEKGETGETGLPNPTASSALDEYALGTTELMSVGKESASASEVRRSDRHRYCMEQAGGRMEVP
jgi:hypothetical protein